MSINTNSLVSTGLGLGAKTLLPLLGFSNPVTAPIAAALTALPALKNALNIGTAHLKANDIVKNVENPFGQAIGQANTLDDLKSAYGTYLSGASQFQSQGGDYSKVADQSLSNPALWQTFNTKWGQLGGGTAPNPMEDVKNAASFPSNNLTNNTNVGNNSNINSFLSQLFPSDKSTGSTAGGGSMNFGGLDLSSLFGNSMTSDGSSGSSDGSDSSGGFLGNLLKMGVGSLPGILSAVGGGKNNAVGGTPGMNAPDWMKFLLPILAGGAGALSNRPSTTTGTSSTTPNLPQNAQDLRSSIIGQYQDLLGKDPNLSGYESSGLNQINTGFDEQRKALEGNLAARGITGPAAETAMQNLENQRFSQGTQFRNQIPLLQTQMKQNILGSALSGFTGLTPTYGSTQKGSQTTPGNILGGGLTGASQALAMLLGMGAFNPAKAGS